MPNLQSSSLKLSRRQRRLLKAHTDHKEKLRKHIASLNTLLSKKSMAPKFVKNAGKAVLKFAEKAAVKEGKKALKASAPAIGNFVSNAPLPGAGLLGDLAEAGAIKIAGNGDYTVTTNSLFSKGGSVDVVPKFHKSKRGTRVTHCEYIGDVISSATANTFSNTSYIVNPGNPTTFPWLSTMAANFDQWRPNGIVFAFKSTSSSYSGTTQALGGVVLASDYDLVDDAYASKIEMENSAFANSCKSDTHILHPVECAIKERPIALLKCRGVQTPSDNLQWYDLANFQVATFGVAGTSVNLGELWVTYDITFFKEQVYGGLRGNTIGLSSYSSTSGITTSAYFGTTPVALADNTFALTLTGTTITLPSSIPVGAYMLYYNVYGTSAAVVSPTITATTNCTLISGFTNAPSQTSTSCRVNAVFTISGPSAVLTLSGGTLPTSPTYAGIYLMQVNPGTT